jgi:hypothetical protein
MVIYCNFYFNVRISINNGKSSKSARRVYFPLAEKKRKAGGVAERDGFVVEGRTIQPALSQNAGFCVA